MADSLTVAEDNGVRKTVPTDKLFVIDMKANPPKLVQTVTVGKQPSGLSFSPDGDDGAGVQPRRRHHQRAENRRHQVTQTGTIPISPGVCPGRVHPGRQARPGGEVAGQQAWRSSTWTATRSPTASWTCRPTRSPTTSWSRRIRKLALTADNGNGGSSDGNADAVSVMDLTWPHPHVIAHVTVEDAPEGLAMSPKGDLAVVLNVNGSNMKQAWFYHPDRQR